jgi:hypothetical protein
VGVVAGMLLAPAAHAAPRSARLVVSGQGGQTLTLSVPTAGLDISYPLFVQSRLAGPDGTVGGVAIQRVSDGRLVGGLLLINAPGFNRALGIQLVDVDRTHLARGRYRLTLLGRGRQQVELVQRGTDRSRRLTARGDARPITRTVAGTAGPVDSWSVALGRTGGGDYVLIGAGSGGDWQQAEDASMCLRATSAVAAAPCVSGDGGGFISPGPGGSAAWSMMLYPPGALERSAYTFSGRVVGIGPSSTTGHAAVVIALRR